MNKKYFRGELYYAELDNTVGSEQNGCRPVLIVSNDIGNKYSSTVIIAAVTSKSEVKANLPTHCCLSTGSGLELPSVVLLEQIRTIDKQRIGNYIGKLSRNQMGNINHAISISFDLVKRKKKKQTVQAKIDSDDLVMCLCQTCRNNFFQTGTYKICRNDYKQKSKDVCDYCNTRTGWDYILKKKPTEK